jgi:hypothetical protein
MNHLDTTKDNDGRDKCLNFAEITETPAGEASPREGFVITFYQTSKGEETKMLYTGAIQTGEAPKEAISLFKIIHKIISTAIELIDEVLEIYDDVIARDNTFSIFEDQIKLLWAQRECTNEHFKSVILFLLIAAKNSRLQTYEKYQYESFKTVLEKINEIDITSAQAKDCISLIGNSGIDLLVPIRNWEKYTIEIKEINGIEK